MDGRLTVQFEDGDGDQVLVGWAEIARYMGRGVRTVQRWHDTLGLPITRPAQRRRGAVMARRSRIDQWLQSLPLRNTGNGQETHGPGGVR